VELVEVEVLRLLVLTVAVGLVVLEVLQQQV
jgi:hypothetical protein